VPDNETSHFTGTRYYRKSGKERLERWVFRRLQILQGRCRRDVTWRGISFQTQDGPCERSWGQRRPEILGRRQSTTVYDGRLVMTLSLDDQCCNYSKHSDVFILFSFFPASKRVDTWASSELLRRPGWAAAGGGCISKRRLIYLWKTSNGSRVGSAERLCSRVVVSFDPWSLSE